MLMITFTEPFAHFHRDIGTDFVLPLLLAGHIGAAIYGGTVVAVLLVIGSGILLIWVADRVYPESAPVARGAAYAETRGCLECHGDPANPQIDANDRDCANVKPSDRHPVYTVECTDVLAYFEAIRLRRTLSFRSLSDPGNLLIAGEQLVRKYHCFQCHGELGQGGFSNSGALKGYVPGYFGDDFKALTNNGDPGSVRKWIMHGMDNDIVEAPVTGPIAAFLFRRQAVSMPRYKSLDPAEVGILVNYVIAINQYGPMTAATVRFYGERSKSPKQMASYHNRQNAKVD